LLDNIYKLQGENVHGKSKDTGLSPDQTVAQQALFIDHT